MIAVTTPAKEMLSGVEVPGEAVLRLDPETDGRLGFVAGEPRSDDQVVEHDGQEILRIADPISRELDGASLDRIDTPEGPRLTIRREEGEPDAANGSHTSEP